MFKIKNLISLAQVSLLSSILFSTSFIQAQGINNLQSMYVPVEVETSDQTETEGEVLSEEEKKRRLSIFVESQLQADFTDGDLGGDQMYRMRLAYEINGSWSVMGTLQYGTEVNNSFSNLSGDSLSVRHLYVQGYDLLLEGSLLEIGAIPPDDGIAELTQKQFDTAVLGARYQIDSPLGGISVTAGSFVDDASASVFNGDNGANYIEIRFNKTVFDILAAESLKYQVGYENYDGDSYLRAAAVARYRFAGRLIDVIKEGVGQDNGAYLISAGVDFDVLGMIQGIEQSDLGIRMRVKHNYQSGQFSGLSNSWNSLSYFDDEGHSTSVELYKEWETNLFGRDWNTYVSTGFGRNHSADPPAQQNRWNITVGIRKDF